MGAVIDAPALPEGIADLIREKGRLVDARIGEEIHAPSSLEGAAAFRVPDFRHVARDPRQLLGAWQLAGYDPELTPEVRQLAERGIGPLAGGAQGAGSAAFLHNVPQQGSFVMNPVEFAKHTERNDVPQETKAFSGLGASRIDQRISNVGVLTHLRLTFVGTLTVAQNGGSCTPTFGWPWNVFKRVTLNANGQTSLIQCEGMDLRARRQRIFRNPIDPVVSAPSTDTIGNPTGAAITTGTYSVLLSYEVPIVHNDNTLTGALFAQSDQTYLNWTVEPAVATDLFTLAGGATATLTGTIHPTLTFFDIPYVDTQQGRIVVLGDMQWLHGFLGVNNAFTNTGDVKSPLIRTAGQLIALYWYIANGDAAQVAPEVLEEVRWAYGGNRTPRVYNPVAVLLEKNAREYNGRLRPGYLCLDFEGDNPARDIVLPKGLSELQVINKIPSSVTVNANARVHFVEETLYAGR